MNWHTLEKAVAKLWDDPALIEFAKRCDEAITKTKRDRESSTLLRISEAEEYLVNSTGVQEVFRENGYEIELKSWAGIELMVKLSWGKKKPGKLERAINRLFHKYL